MEALETLSKKELLSMLRFGADRIFATAEGKPPSDADLDALIDRSQKVAKTAGAPSDSVREVSYGCRVQHPTGNLQKFSRLLKFQHRFVCTRL